MSPSTPPPLISSRFLVSPTSPVLSLPVASIYRSHWVVLFTDWTLHDGFQFYYKNTLSIVAGACLGMFYLWPMMALQLGVGKPSFWFFKLGAYVVLGVAMVILGNIPGLDLQIG